MERLLTTEEAVALTGMSKSWFEKCRFMGNEGPPYIKLPRAVRYKESDLLKYFEGKMVIPAPPKS